MSATQQEFKPTLSLLDATMIVAGSMIGSGIFIVSADITRNVGSAGWLLFVWLITGFMTLTAALSYGELSAMFPKAGGQYVYLKEAFNKLAGFLYGWSFFTVIQTATIAAVGVAFSKFTGYFIPALDINDENILFQLGFFKLYPAQLVSIAVIALLTYINTKGVQGGKIIQTIFTITKLVSLFGLIVFGLLLAAKADVWNANWENAWQMSKIQEGGMMAGIAGSAVLGAIAASMTGSIFSSDAWNNVTFIAGEIKNPKRNIGLSLFLGTLIVTIIYIAANIMYISVLPLNGGEQSIAFAKQDRVAVAAANEIFGSIGMYVIAVMIMISTFGCINGLVLSGARVYYTMAQDGLFFKQAGTLNENAVPQWALWAQCVWASLLCLSGQYGDLLDMISFVVVLFYVLTIMGIFVLRAKRPDMERPYKAFAYPVLPIIYIVLGLTFCFFLITMKPLYAGIGLGIVLLGIPVYYIAVANQKKAV
ncbi:amino acid/polyamine/organocation transporter, APC superfamily (TC 2.A.3) [Lacibacter cauensis]|uniref:Amino acid/polyamine/organocation transporter, APC superfamily (TC 2.A.3) n=1 Tax=Lacibacter cauensis TaxID=510947 RepID=A0A562SE50_9BACT|nr:amino acid permease [Lacibacter cauensis]TWI79066.1 amino acid/polyamine/organocation transporter, APC superfamily (TC 2.A.3) [Lacibacter cauensis]